MVHFIDKDALVVMIKSRMATNKHENPLTASAYVEDEEILAAIDSLDVKEIEEENEWIGCVEGSCVIVTK